MTENQAVSQEDVRLPENAFRELKPGEKYEPAIPAAISTPENLRPMASGVEQLAGACHVPAAHDRALLGRPS